MSKTTLIDLLKSHIFEYERIQFAIKSKLLREMNSFSETKQPMLPKLDIPHGK
jgi:hypothetical protein